jgi:hypothetical protein
LNVEAEAMSTAARTGDNEVTIVARVFDDERGLLPRDLARTILDVEFSERIARCPRSSTRPPSRSTISFRRRRDRRSPATFA